MSGLRVAIVGGTGYGGMELVRWLLGHPEATITAITSRSETGAVGDVHPHLRGLTDLRFTADRAVDLARTNDLLFFATPHGVARKEVPAVLEASPTVKVIDLSNDWRLDALTSPDAWAAHHDEPIPDWLPFAAYGLPECGGRAEVRRPGCRLVANPGCHASAAILALHPLARSGLWQGRPRPAVVSVTGSSGSGATPSQGTHHPERFSNFRAYKPLEHQHQREIEVVLATFGGAHGPVVDLVPCSGPFSRGIGSTTILDLGERLVRGTGDTAETLEEGEALELVRAAFRTAYATEPFVRLVPETPEVRAVAYTNLADVGVTVRAGSVCVTVAIDNLGKGMAGTAVQNMNLLFGLDETLGLRRAGAGL